MTGEPSVRVYFTVDAPLADVNLVAKVCAVLPDGRSFLITYNSASATRAQVAGSVGDAPVYVADLLLRPTAYLLGAGERLRLAISGSNFPQLWPTPRRYRLRLLTAAPYQTSLVVPVAPPQAPPLPAPAIAPPPRVVVAAAIDGGSQIWRHDLLSGNVTRVVGRNWGSVRIEPGSRLEMSQDFVFEVDADHPETATARSTTVWRLDRPTAPVEVRATTLGSQGEIQVDAEVDLAGHPYFRGHWCKPTGPSGD
jgi:hypothetical protein